MKVQFENKVMSSLLLFVDHEVTQKGDAYTNTGSAFYKIDSLFNDYYVYSSPFKQLVSDVSVTGSSTPTVLSGIYFSTPPDPGGAIGPYSTGPMYPGSGGFDSINHMQGQLYFTGDTDPVAGSGISGSYSVKDFNIFLTSMPEEQLLFETKLNLNPRTSDLNSSAGMEANTQSYPAIFIKDNGGRSEEFAFGGIDDTIINARAIVLADSMFSLDAACGILKDTARESLPLIENDTLPFDARGAYTGELFNYNDFKTGLGMNISDVFVSKVMSNRGDFTNLNPDVYSAFVDFELRKVRTPRAS